MSFSFSIPSKPKKPSTRNPAVGVPPEKSDLLTATRSYVTEFNPADAPPPPASIKPIAPLPNRPNKKLKHNLPEASNDLALQFEVDNGTGPESDGSMSFGLNLRQGSEGKSKSSVGERSETISEMELRMLKEDLRDLPEDPGMEEYDEVPVEGFGAALLLGYGWKEGRGIGKNAKEDVKVAEVVKKAGRGGLGFTGELPGKIEDLGNVGNANENIRKERKESFDVGKEVRVVAGREMGMKGKVVEVKNDGELLVLRLSRSNEKVRVRVRDVADVGSAEEEKCLKKLKELKIKEKDVRDKSDRNSSKKRGQEVVVEKEKRGGSERVNWLRNHIRVRIISEDLKGGRLFLKKGVVVDVVGPGICDVSIDESRELVQGVDQELLETALPKRGGPVMVLCGRHKGVYGTLVERNSEKERGVVRDADTHELLNVKLEQVAEYTGDPDDIGY